MNLNKTLSLGIQSHKAGDIQTAEQIYTYALEADPHNAQALFLLGMIRFEQQHIDESIDYFNQAILLVPQYAEAYYNLGVALKSIKRIPEAIEAFTRALEFQPDAHEALWNRALCRLISGDLTNGLPELEQASEHRTSLGLRQKRTYDKPEWTGESIQGKRLLVYAEQGLGDTIQYARFLPMLKERYQPEVLFECQSCLCELMKDCGGYDRMIPQRSEAPVSEDDFDLHISLVSLPAVFGTTRSTIPAEIPYITVARERIKKWKTALPASHSNSVGLVWSGNPYPVTGRHRHCKLQDFAPLAQAGNISFVGLQKVQGTDIDLTPPDGLDFTNIDQDLLQSAAILMNLDLLITIDTSMAHLAGALGRPVWVLLSYNNDWRWFLDGSNTPWYPDMKLFRQPRPEDWPSVMNQVAEDLQNIFTT